MTDIVGRLEWACWVAERGLTVFILEPESKRPLDGYSWYTRNTTDPEVISDWFDETPDCNYAVHPGDEYVVIDLDRKPNSNGVAAFEELCAENGISDFLRELDTLVVETPSGGFHLYFKTPFPCANKHDLPEGIDVRGAIGYVVGPGSASATGEWRVLDSTAEIMDLPDWLAEKLYEPGRKDPRREEPVVEWDLPESIEQGREWLTYQPPAIEGENGDDHTYWTVCALRDLALSESMILKMLNEGGATSWNARCEPAWGLDELQVKIENSFEYASNRPGVRSLAYLKNRHASIRPAGGYNFTNAQLDELHHPTTPLQRLRLAAEGGEITPEYEEDPEIPDAPDDEYGIIAAYEEQHANHEFWYGFEDFAALDKVREYVIKDWLIAHGITGIIAKRGTGKSTIALDISCHLATDTPWWGTPIQEGWKIIYLCGEDDEGMILNCRAWAQRHGKTPTNDRFMVGRGILNLSRDDERLEGKLKEMVAWAGGARVLVVLDTWQRATAGMKSNADDEMEKAVEMAETIAEVLNGPMLICYHPPKDGRMTVRGSGVQEDTTSGLWDLEPVSGEGLNVLLTIQRAKGKGVGTWRKFSLKPTDVGGEDSYGDALQGIVVEKVAGKEDANTADYQATRAEERKAWARALFGLLTFYQEVDGMEPPPGGHVTVSGAAKDLVRYWRTRSQDEVAGKFCDLYLNEAERAKLTEGLEKHDWKPVQRALLDYFASTTDRIVTIAEEGGVRVAFTPKGTSGGTFKMMRPA